MGREDPHDRIHGPCWRDRLKDAPETAWKGDDVILTRDFRARKAWHRVLCELLHLEEGGTLKTLAGNIDWFYLSLTAREVDCLIESARSRV